MGTHTLGPNIHNADLLLGPGPIIRSETHLMFLFRNKEATSVWKFESLFHNLMPQM